MKRWRLARISVLAALMTMLLPAPVLARPMRVSGAAGMARHIHAARDARHALTPQAPQWKRSPVWTGDQTGPVDAGGKAWYDPAFDDSAWDDVSLPDSGSDSTLDDRYYRSTFTWDGSSVVMLHVASDDGLTVYVNGTLLGTWGQGWRAEGCVNDTTNNCNINSTVDDQLIPSTLLHTGDGANTIAIDLWNGACCGYALDASISGIVAVPTPTETPLATDTPAETPVESG